MKYDRLILLIISFLLIGTLLFYYLYFFGKKELILNPDFGYGPINDTSSVFGQHPASFLLDTSVWPEEHYKNNLIIVILIVHDWKYGIILAVLWEVFESINYLIASSIYLKWYNVMPTNPTFNNLLYESAGDSIIGDLFQALLAIVVSYRFLYKYKIPYKISWAYKKFDYIPMYLSLIILCLLNYATSFNFVIKYVTAYDFLQRAPLAPYFGLICQLIFFELLRQKEIFVHEKIYKKNKDECLFLIKKINIVYNFLMLHSIILRLASIYYTNYTFMTTFFVGFFYILTSFIK